MENIVNDNRYSLRVTSEKQDKRRISTVNAILCESFDEIATISGFVYKEEGTRGLEPADDVNVCITKTVDITKVVATTATNSMGYYEFKGVPAGSYFVKIYVPDLKAARSEI